jgi:hypothetical protein
LILINDGKSLGVFHSTNERRIRIASERKRRRSTFGLHGARAMNERIGTETSDLGRSIVRMEPTLQTGDGR